MRPLGRLQVDPGRLAPGLHRALPMLEAILAWKAKFEAVQHDAAREAIELIRSDGPAVYMTARERHNEDYTWIDDRAGVAT